MGPTKSFAMLVAKILLLATCIGLLMAALWLVVASVIGLRMNFLVYGVVTGIVIGAISGRLVKRRRKSESD